MFPYKDSGGPASYFQGGPVGRGAAHDFEEYEPMLAGFDVNNLINRSKDFIVKSTGKEIWTVDMMSLRNLVGHFGYSVVESAVGYSQSGDVSSIPCRSVDGWKHPIYIRSMPANFTIKYETRNPGISRFKFGGMKIYQIEEIDNGHSPVVISSEEAFPGVEKLGSNKFNEVVLSVGKVLDDLDRLLLSKEQATSYIYQ